MHKSFLKKLFFSLKVFQNISFINVFKILLRMYVGVPVTISMPTFFLLKKKKRK